MGLLDRFKKKEEPVVPEPVKVEPPKKKVTKKKKPKAKKKPVAKPVAIPLPAVPLSEKERATMAGEPYINVIGFELDKENQLYGNFELDWNHIFIARLVKAGFQGKTDADIVDAWFKMVCSSIVAELYEQEIADPEKRRRIQRKKLSDGRTEIS